METRNYVEYLLKNYHQIKREIDMLSPLIRTQEAETIEDTIEAMAFKTSQEEKVQRSKVSDKTPDLALNYRKENEMINMKIQEDLSRVIKGNELELLKLERSIATLNLHERKVIEGIYIKRQPRRLLCTQLFISENTLNRYRKKGMEQLVKVFRGYFGELK